MQEEEKSNLHIAVPKILQIVRLHIVLGGALAFVIGALIAALNGGAVKLELIFTGYLVVFLGDLSTHFGNDFYDVEIDANAEKKFFSGSKILVENPNLRALSRNISIMLLISSNCLAAAAVILINAPMELFVIMACANLLAWFYSAPPLRLVNRGFGEFLVAMVTGFVIPAVGYLSVRGQLDLVFFYFAFPFVMYGLILSLSLHLPDSDIDQKNGKKTFIVRKGRKTAMTLILISAIASSLSFLSYHFGMVNFPVEMNLVSAMSIVPLLIVAVGFLKFWKKHRITIFAASNVFSLFLFNALLVTYLIYTFAEQLI